MTDSAIGRSAAPPPPARCPRCGAAMGELRRAAAAPAIAPQGRAPRSAAAELYCGCCGLVVTDAR